MIADKTISTKQAAAIAGVTPVIIQRACKRGKIAGEMLSARFWLVSVPSLHAWIDNESNHKRGNPAFVKGRPQGSLASRKERKRLH